MIQYNISLRSSRGFSMTARRRPTWLHPAALAASVLLPGAAAAEQPEVIASIKPIHSLAAAVMAGVAVPELLVPGAASPHSYALRPSDAARSEEHASELQTLMRTS